MTWADLESGADAAAICGSLGVFELPEGSDPALVRLCSDHPSLGRPGSNGGVGTLACAKNQKGCDKGYCWKQCGENGAGWWCWTALGDGSGPWKTCVAGSDCGMGDPCGWSKNLCPKCGCSC
ncbi:hypothetical protein K456DRAFT_1847485 [Colletotrichum gloeosporioides 23]|nr:hypothetical protein K456DRAFT_1847485 [Colletotrichum gloeosporioides 23]